jgi:hypothetical protein
MTVWGFFVQNVDYAITIPIYLAIYLATSPTVYPTKAAILTDVAEVYSIPVSIFLGYTIPSIGAALPALSMQSFDAKQTWLAMWQGFPLWISVFQQLVKRLLRPVLQRSPSPSISESRDALRLVYSVLFYTSLTTHLGCLAVSALSMAVPDIFGAEYKGGFNFSSVLLPAAITGSSKVPNLSAGALLLLQYDEIVGSTAMLLWAMFMSSQVTKVPSAPGTWLKLLVRASLAMIIYGPGGSIVKLIQERDEQVFEQKSM